MKLVVDSGLADQFVPELPALQLEIDEHHRHKDVYEHTLTVVEQAIDLETDGPDLTLRLAALLHDIGKPATRRFEPGGGVSFHHHEMVGARMTRKRLKALRYPKDVVVDVARLVELHLRFHGYADGEWTDSAVRRYVRDAGAFAAQAARPHPRGLHHAQPAQGREAGGGVLRSRATHRGAGGGRGAERRFALTSMATRSCRSSDIPPGRVVGEAYQYLLEVRLDQGPLGHRGGHQGSAAVVVRAADATVRSAASARHRHGQRRSSRAPTATATAAPSSRCAGRSAIRTTPPTKATLKTHVVGDEDASAELVVDDTLQDGVDGDLEHLGAAPPIKAHGNEQ